MLMLVIIENTSTSSTVQEMIVPPRRSRAYAKFDAVAARSEAISHSDSTARAVDVAPFKSNSTTLKRSRGVAQVSAPTGRQTF